MQSNYKIPSPSLADCCFCLIVFCFVFHRPFVRDDERRLLGFIVVFGGRTSLQWLRAVPRLQNKLLCLVSFPPTPNSWLLCPPVDPRPLDLPLNRLECVWGRLFHFSPLSENRIITLQAYLAWILGLWIPTRRLKADVILLLDID
jgi:hypothetical protein